MRRLITALAVCAALLGFAPAADAGGAPKVTAVGRFTPGNDNPALPEVARGTAKFAQHGPTGPITGYVSAKGLTPGGVYTVVPYRDPLCTPAPGVTAYPSSAFTADATGSYAGPITVNPASVNPAGTFDVSMTMSVSLRQVFATNPPGSGLPPVVPNPVFSSCDGMPVVR